MSTHVWRTIRNHMLAMLLGALLLLPALVAAAPPTGKLLAKNDPSGATCSSGACTTADGDQQPDPDRKLGTAINWMESPDAASRAAIDEGKLVFMIQVSGNFARQEFT